MRRGLFLVLVAVLWGATVAVGAPRGPEHARKVVQGWLRVEQGKPLGSSLGQAPKKIDTFTDGSGEPLYHIVYLEPAGYVIVPADDEVEPVVGFSSGGIYDPSPENPMGALVSEDMASRVAAARGEKHDPANPKHRRFIEARSKWQRLDALDNGIATADTTHVGSVSEVRVAPLVQSKWSQSAECSNNCYNIYTPNNYVCGCVATAQAQLMRFHQYPAAPTRLGPFTIYVDGSAQSRTLRGGNGSGGNYAWADMVLDPGCSTTLAQRQAIGALCHDTGVSVNMYYSDGASGAYTVDCAASLVSTFGYGNALSGYNSDNNIAEINLNKMLNPNLDAGYPCLLAIRGSPGGHAIVCDGYGYSSTTLYHHLNLGWAGSDDAWYDLPGIDTSIGTFSIVTGCVYNVYVSGSGEIISGRVADSIGDPISGAVITATAAGGAIYEATTNARGIYALAKVPSNKAFTIQATKPGYNFVPVNVSTGKSTTMQTTTGNQWAVDFIQSPNTAAELTNISVTPINGTIFDSYYFSVDYYDVEGDAPASDTGTLIFHGASDMQVPMTLESGTLDNGKYSCIVTLGSGAHGFKISFTDTLSMVATTAWQSGPYVDLCSQTNSDTIVNFMEFVDLASHWMVSGCGEGDGWCDKADIDHSGRVDAGDLMLVSGEWMMCPVGGGSEFFLVAGGQFDMGDKADGANAVELPVHRVALGTYSIGRQEVTNAKYCEALNWAKANGHVTVASGIVKGVGNNQAYCDTTTSHSQSHIVWNGSSFSAVAGKENRPMMLVTWMGAAAYCNWRSEIEQRQPCYNLTTWDCNSVNHGYRLPTEAEWEYAARGGLDGMRYPWGNNIASTQVNYNGSGSPYQTGTQPYTTPAGFYDGQLHNKADFGWPGAAATYQTTSGINAYTMYDVAGNVYEHCNDWYNASYYGTRPSLDVDPKGPATGTSRVTRGGSWNSPSSYCRVSWRSGTPPTLRANSIGFRVALRGEGS